MLGATTTYVKRFSLKSVSFIDIDNEEKLHFGNYNCNTTDRWSLISACYLIFFGIQETLD